MKHSLPEPSKDTPFEHCKLERGKYAEPLTQIVSKYKEGFVLALNNEWGGGKTTFVKMWEKYLNREGFKTIYFNAWENDFDSNASVPLIAELKSLAKETQKTNLIKPLLKNASVLAQNVGPVAIKALATKLLGEGNLSNLLEALSKATTEIFEAEIDKFIEKKQGILDFRLELQNYVNEISPDKPIVFILDELDRCRPTYAVEVLEQVKHFFSVKGIVFVLAIDKQQLENSIKGFYGSNEIDAKGYLKRFIDLEFNLPNPNIDVYIKYLYNYYNLDSFFKSDYRIKWHPTNDKNIIIETATMIASVHNLSLRDIEKLFINLSLTISQCKQDDLLVPNVLFLLIFMRSHFYGLYKEIRDLRIKPEVVISKVESEVVIESIFNNLPAVERLISSLLFNYYYAYLKNHPKYELFNGNRFRTAEQFSRYKSSLEVQIQTLHDEKDYIVPVFLLIDKIDMTNKFIGE